MVSSLSPHLERVVKGKILANKISAFSMEKIKQELSFTLTFEKLENFKLINRPIKRIQYKN
jgi:hypothetical protein